MVLNFSCELCNYQTTNKSNYNKHLKTRKHMDKTITHDCPFCKRGFRQRNGLSRHIKSCFAKKNNESNKKIKNIKKNANNEINYLKKDMGYKMEILKERTGHEIEILKERTKTLEAELNNKNMMLVQMSHILNQMMNFTHKTTSTYKMITNTYNTNPPITAANAEYICNNMEDSIDMLLESLEYSYKHNVLDVYIGKTIVKEYKKNNVHEQSLFNSDTSRLTYIVRECVSEIDCWSFDKKGVKTKEYIITPVLNKIKDIINKSIPDIGVKLSNAESNTSEFEEFIETMSVLSKIRVEIEDNTLGNKVIKYISPYFYLGSNIESKKIEVEIDMDVD